MKERPIIFSTLMVQAILQGRKTMTRRVIKSKTGLFQVSKANYEPDAAHFYHDRSVSMLDENERDVGTLFCPYGNPGDRLWVRETHLRWTNITNERDIVFKTDDDFDQCYSDMIKLRRMGFPKDEIGNWKVVSSIHMPRSASRILLEITNVRVERVQDITENDARKEGVPDSIPISDMNVLSELGDWQIPSPFLMHQFSFLNTWCKIYGAKSWLQNQWVWVIEFKKI